MSGPISPPDPSPPWQQAFVVGFVGVRGVVSLAAALAIPLTVSGGAPFPHRDLILFVTFGVIIITLVGQGLTLPTVILAFFYGQSRIFFVMARDGLIPPGLARVSGRGSPTRITIFTAIVVAILAGLIPLAAGDQVFDLGRQNGSGRRRNVARFRLGRGTGADCEASWHCLRVLERDCLRQL